jgi:PIN domain nuclease of toxin-antitoxin system
VKLLLDTHILLWAAGQPEKLSESTRTLLTTPENGLFFSAASIWEIVIKLGLGREDFKVDPYRLVLIRDRAPIVSEFLPKLGNLSFPCNLSFP